MKKIVVDAYGGDNAPLEIIEGALLARDKHKDIEIILCGKEEEMKKNNRSSHGKNNHSRCTDCHY